MKQLMEHFMLHARDNILEDGFGDWFDPGGASCCTHTPPELTTTIWYYNCSKVMARFADLLGEKALGKTYAALASQIKRSFNRKFLNTRIPGYGSQTANSMVLYFDLFPKGLENGILQSLVEDILRRDKHLNTGIMGIRYLFEVLTNHGYGNLALDLMHQDSYPGFGDLIHRGATTLWEYWGEEQHDLERGARSLNHPMMGGFDNWFYNTLGGIRPDPRKPGFERFFLQPHPIPGLNHVQVEHTCRFGLISSCWACNERQFRWEIVVPESTSAVATLPFSRKLRVLQPGSHLLRESMT